MNLTLSMGGTLPGIHFAHGSESRPVSGLRAPRKSPPLHSRSSSRVPTENIDSGSRAVHQGTRSATEPWEDSFTPE